MATTEVPTESQECDVCGGSHQTEYCPELGLAEPGMVIEFVSRARLTLPEGMQIIEMTDGSLGISSKVAISPKTQLGPFEAKRTNCDIEAIDFFILKMFNKDGSITCYDASGENECNWMCFIRPADTSEEQNCMAYTIGQNVFYSVTREIQPEEELRVWYAPHYAKKLGRDPCPNGATRTMLGALLITEQPEPAMKTELREEGEGEGEGTEEGTEEKPVPIHTCHICSLPFFTESDFAKHLRGHIVPETATRGPYKCKKCPAKYKRLTRLRQHAASHNKKHVCGVCKRGFTTLMYLNRHVEKVHGQEDESGAGKKVSGEDLVGEEPGELPGSDKDQQSLGEDVGDEDLRASPGRDKVTERTKDPRSSAKEQLGESPGLNKSTRTKDPQRSGEDVVGEQPEGTDQVYEAAVRDSDIQEAAESILSLKKAVEATKTDRIAKESDVELEEFIPTMPREGETVIKQEPIETTETNGEERDQASKEIGQDGSNNNSQTGTRKNTMEKQSPENINRLEQDKASKITNENRNVGSTNNSLAKTPQKTMETKTPETNREEQVSKITKADGTNSLAVTPKNTMETPTPVKRSRGRPPKSKNKRPNFHYVPAETVDPVPILPDIKVEDSSGRRILPRRALKGVRTTGKLAEKDDSSLSPRKAKGGEVPSQGHQKKGRGRPRKSDVDSEVGQTGGEDDGKDSDGVEDGGEEDEVMGDEEEEEFVDDAEDADFKPPNRIKKNDEDEDDDIDEQDENLEDEDTYKERSRWKKRRGQKSWTPHKKRRRRTMKDEEILALEELTSVTYSEEGEKLYNCGKCGKQFTQRSYLRLHLPAHTDRYKCEDCGKRFTRNESFQKHQCLKTKQILYMKEKQQESDPDIYCCAHCHKEFTQEDYVIKHFSLHTSKLKCPQCGVLFPAEGDLAKHLETECQKSTEKEFPCTICKQSFKNEKYLYRHMAMHTDIHKCEKCGKCYSRKDSWQTHMLRCMPETLENHQIFVCTNCKKTFATQLGANNHMANCARHFCAECKTAFQSPDALASHECHGAELNKNITIQFQCTKCGKSFSSITYLNRHQASHQGAFECPICHKHFSRKEEHSSHYRFCLAHSKIAEVGEIDCEICKLIFKDSKEYRDHYQTHTHPFQCTLCFKRFIKIGTLHNHKCDPLMLDESSSVVQCNICQKRFKGEKYLLRHQIIHSEPNFECEFCHRKFFRKDYLSDHVCSLPDGTKVRMVRKRNRVHVRENLVCHLCGRPFTSVSNLNKHMKIHGEKKFSCKICHKKFHFENYVKIHTEMVHEKKFRYQCSYCGKVVTSKAGLMCHIRQFHTTNAPVHKCPKCNKEFRQRGNLKTHMFSHDDEKKFVCTFCSKAFKYPEQLKRHTLEHTMVTKLACKRCDKKFVRMYDLKRHHLNYHSGIIYVCVLCHERCAHRHTMVRHFRRKHPQNMHLVQNPATLDEMRRQSDVAATIKEEPGETTILLETVDQLDSAMTDGQGSTQIILPHNMAAEALQDLSNAVVTTDQLGQETLTIPSSLHSAVQTVQAVESIDEDDQTVVILQIINPGEQDITEEVIASIEGVEFIQQEADGEHHSNVTETIEIQPEGVDETVGDETMTVVAGDQAASQPEAVAGGEETLTDIATDETITETTVDDGPTTG